MSYVSMEKLFQSVEIKKLIVAQSQKHNIPLQYACSKVGINYREFLVSYLNSENGSHEITEEAFMRLINLLGVVHRHQFVIDESIDMLQRKEEVTEWFEKYRTRQ